MNPAIRAARRELIPPARVTLDPNSRGGRRRPLAVRTARRIARTHLRGLRRSH